MPHVGGRCGGWTLAPAIALRQAPRSHVGTTSESQTAAGPAASADAAAPAVDTPRESSTAARSAPTSNAAPALDVVSESSTMAAPAIVDASASTTGSAAPTTAPAPSDAGEPVSPLADPGPAGAGSFRGIAGLAVRTWLSYLVPLTLLSALALSPLVALTLGVHAPADPAAARTAIQLGWMLLAVAWPGQFILVGGAAAMLSEPRSQLRAFTRGLLQLIRAVVPCLVAALAVAIGSLALVLPGLVLLVLLSLTGASRERGLPAPLLDSLAAARRQLPAVVLAVLALFALDAAIGLVAYRMFLAPLPARPTPIQLAAVRSFVRAIALALVVLSPLPAALLATIRARIDL